MTHCCHHSHSNEYCISLVPIFNHLEDEQMAEIMTTVHSRTFKKGEMIYQAGDEASSLYIVNQGKIKIYRLADTGKDILLRILNQGDFMGELALFAQSTHDDYAEAMKDTQVCIINRSDLQQFLMKYPTISLKILSEFSNRLQQSEQQTTRFATEKVETRIALFLAECSEQENSLQFSLPISKKDIASYLGTTPETISRKLAEFEQKKLIIQKSHKNIEIIDLDGLLLV